MRPSLRYGLHPVLPVRLGFRRLLEWGNPALARALADSDAYTLVPARSRVTLARLAKDVLDRKIPGDFAEFGVHRGGTAAVLASLLKGRHSRTLHLFDRWGDLPEPTKEDGAQQEKYARSNISDKLAQLPQALADAQGLMARIGFDRAVFHQGWYEETLPGYAGAPLAFVYVDCDYYQSVKLVLDFIAGHAADGCIVLVDDYGEQWPGAKQATDEFCGQRAIVPEVVLGQAVLRL
jgi:hypothetical protein